MLGIVFPYTYSLLRIFRYERSNVHALSTFCFWFPFPCVIKPISSFLVILKILYFFLSYSSEVSFNRTFHYHVYQFSHITELYSMNIYNFLCSATIDMLGYKCLLNSLSKYYIAVLIPSI